MADHSPQPKSRLNGQIIEAAQEGDGLLHELTDEASGDAEREILDCREQLREQETPIGQLQVKGHMTPTQKSYVIKHRVLKNIAVFTLFGGLGFSMSLIGPTLVSLEILLDSDTKTLALTFTIRSIGLILGSLFSAAIYDRLNKELIFFVAALVESIAIFSAPFTRNLYGFITAMSIEGFAYGIIASGVQSYVLLLWEDSRYKRMAIHCFQSIWSICATVCPITIRPFLPELFSSTGYNCSRFSNGSLEYSSRMKKLMPYANGTGTDTSTATAFLEVGGNTGSDQETPMEHNINNSLVSSSNEVLSMLPGPEDGSFEHTPISDGANASCLTVRLISSEEAAVVQYAYVLVSAILLVGGTLYLIIYIMSCLTAMDKNKRSSNDRRPVIKEDLTTTNQSQSAMFVYSMLFLLFGYGLTYGWALTIPNCLLATLVIKGYDWPNQQGSLIQSVFWGAIGGSRLLVACVSQAVTPACMLFAGMGLTTCAYSLMLFSHFSETILWVSVALAGFGLSGIFASIILWMSHYVVFGGKANTCLVCGVSVASMTGPVFAGYLLQEVGHMTVAYLLVGASGANLLLFCVTYFYARRHAKRALSLVVQSEKEIGEDIPI